MKAKLFHVKETSNIEDITATYANAKYLAKFWQDNSNANPGDLVHFCDGPGDDVCKKYRNSNVLIIDADGKFRDLCSCIDDYGMVPGSPTSWRPE